MKYGDSNPNVNYLIKLADYFHCSTDYLLNRTDIPTLIDNLDKNNTENANFIYKYSCLSNEDKKLFDKFLEFLYTNNSKK